MTPDPKDVTLREFMELRFAALEEKVQDLERKMDRLIWTFMGGVCVAILVAWLRQSLGL